MTPLGASTQSLTLTQPIAWRDEPSLVEPGPARVIRLPSGTYSAEARDGDYVYYRAPADVEYRIFNDGVVINARDLPGGVLLATDTHSAMPAGVYMSLDATRKVITFRMGPGFLRLEGTQWTRSP